MEPLPWHPAVVHVPIGLAVLMPLLTGSLVVASWRGGLPRAAWWLAVLAQAVLLAGAIAAVRTGEAEEDRVEDRVAHAVVHDHEEIAEKAPWAAGVVLVLLVLAAVLRPARAARALGLASLVGALALLVLLLRVGQTGGAVVHGPGGLAAGAGSPPASAPEVEDDD